MSISDEGACIWGSAPCSPWSRDAGTVGSGPGEAPPQRGFQRREGCAALLRALPGTKGESLGWAAPGGSGNRQAAGGEPGVDSGAPDL